MKQNINLNRAMQEYIQEIDQSVFTSEKLKTEIDIQIKEAYVMKKFNKKKFAVMVVAACMLLSAGTLASGGFKGGSYVGRGSSVNDITDFSELDQLKDDFGHSFNAVEVFANGYRFTGGAVGDTKRLDDAGQVIASARNVNMYYESNGSELIFEVIPVTMMAGADLPAAGTVIFQKHTNKFVPSNYVLTEEDKVNMERDDYFISYGVDSIEIRHPIGVYWQKGGMHYHMWGWDIDLSEQELRDMAQEVMDSGK